MIRVVDAQFPERLDVATNSFEGTEEWTSIETSFKVSSDTRLVRVEITRARPRDIETTVTGTGLD